MEQLKNLLTKLKLFKIVRKICIKPFYLYKSYIFNKYALNALKDVDKGFKELKVDYWLDFGTMLGCVREKDFIKHDLDLDFGVVYSKRNKDIEEVFKRNSLIKRKEIWLKDQKILAQESYTYKNKINIDIYYYREILNELLLYDFIKEENSSYDESIKKNGGLDIVITRYPKSELINVEFKNGKYKIPKMYKKYLEITYGKDYMKPKKPYENYYLKSLEKIKDKGIVVKFNIGEKN